MQYVLYKATSPSGKLYVGVTNNFKRRLKEHTSSPYAFGCALRKYGKDNFTYEFELYPDAVAALKREAELVTDEAVRSGLLYNECVGGTLSAVLMQQNPMHNPAVVALHPGVFSSENNPMNDPAIRAKASEFQAEYKKPVWIEGVRYEGVREAARTVGISRQLLVHRLRSTAYTTYYYEDR